MKKEEIVSWVQLGPQPVLLNAAEQLGREIKEKKLTTSQIRQVFTRLKSIEAKGYATQRTDFMMLKPYLAYAAGRQDRVEGLRLFKEKITIGIDAVFEGGSPEKEPTRFVNFCKLFEAVLAYHRAFGGK
jgi:CRISPR-associated protein Csm2